MGQYLLSNGRRLASDEWLTPPWMLNILGPFDLDPCSPVELPWQIAQRRYTVEDDGLSQLWSGRVWLNPPFGKGLDAWITKLAQHGDGLAVFPLRSTDTAWFHEAVWSKAAAVLFIRGRIRFYTPEGKESGPCPHASILVAWGESNAEILSKTNIKGHLIRGEQ